MKCGGERVGSDLWQNGEISNVKEVIENENRVGRINPVFVCEEEARLGYGCALQLSFCGGGVVCSCAIVPFFFQV